MAPDVNNLSKWGIARISFALGITGALCFLFLILLVILLNYFVVNTSSFVTFFNFLLFISILSSFSGLLCGILALFQSKGKPLEKRIAIRGVLWSLSGIVIIVLIALPNFFHASTRSFVSRAKAEEKSIAKALEAYHTDNKAYPTPDYDEEGKPIIPNILTTPTAYLRVLFHDPFKNNGRGYYGYAMDPIYGFILTSYGPDCADGILAEPFPKQKAISDILLGYPLETSGFTYDPTNGTTSSGDIWLRGH